jgi:hypothetical protein
MIGPSFHSIKRAQLKDTTGVLQYVIMEPVPVRLALAKAIQAGCKKSSRSAVVDGMDVEP